MIVVTIKGHNSGLPAIVECFKDQGGTFQCPTCGQAKPTDSAMFDHIAWKHPLLVKGESGQR